ncbi:pinin [Anoplophora glabripennis]|uniref:pinin n=1 Tax=Anoplophora glabripennis TaxID=217634 RepID=UPI000C775F0A|nr:pinin [Anoplophora glabripennis]
MINQIEEMDVLKSFSNLQFELEEAKHSLKSVDDNIKKIIGRDPSELPSKLNKKRLPQFEEKVRTGLKTLNRARKITYEIETPVSKRRNSDSIFKRLSTAVQEDVHQNLQKQLISKVIVTSREVPSREDALEAQKKDEKFRARNRRMFGALLGTLQKFQQEETKLKPRIGEMILETGRNPYYPWS